MSAHGNLTRIDNALDDMEKQKQDTQKRLKNLYAQAEAAKAELARPFPQEEEYKAKSARLAELNAGLNIDNEPANENPSESEIESEKKLDSAA